MMKSIKLFLIASLFTMAIFAGNIPDVKGQAIDCVLNLCKTPAVGVAFVTSFHANYPYGGDVFVASNGSPDYVNSYPSATFGKIWRRLNSIKSIDPLMVGAMNGKNFKISMYSAADRILLFGSARSYADSLTLDFVAWQHCLDALMKDYKIEASKGTYYINSTLRLPEPASLPDRTNYIIHGNGADLLQTSGVATLFTMPQSDQQSRDVFCKRTFEITYLNFIGRCPVALAIGGSYQSLILGCDFRNADTAMVLRHFMQGRVIGNNWFGTRRIGALCASGVGGWPNSKAEDSGSNMVLFQSNKNHTFNGQYCAVYVDRSSEVDVDNLAMDGGAKSFIDYCVYYNTGGATTVKDGKVRRVHGECGVDSAVVKFRGSASSQFIAEDFYIQINDAILIETESTGPGSVNVTASNFCYVTNYNFGSKGVVCWKLSDISFPNKQPLFKSGNGYTVPAGARLSVLNRVP